jgi:NADH-quinone oxidoreductase subunit C
MKPVLENVIAQLRTAIGSAVEDVTEFRDDVVVTIARKHIVDAVLLLRDNTACPFPLCEDVFGIDQFRQPDRFEVNYHFFSVQHKVRIHFKIRVDEKTCEAPSITGVFPGADWYEREAFDMYGIVFTGHPDLRRAYMPEDYEYYPLRKDFPMMGVPGSIPLPKR